MFRITIRMNRSYPPQEYWDLYEGEPIAIPEFPDDLNETYSVLDQWLNGFHGVNEVDLKDPVSLRRVRRAYYALVTYVDDKLGALMQALQESGLLDNTIVIFASDHGDMLCEKGMVQKRTFYEWSCRTPLVIRFPNGYKAGSRIAQPVSLLDLAPTMMDLAGIHNYLPGAGQSLAPLIDGSDDADRVVFSEIHSEGVFGTCFMARWKNYKYVYIRHKDGEDTQLFDLSADPGEWHNLAGLPDHDVTEDFLKGLILEQFDPEQIEADVRASLERRSVLKAWVETEGVLWDYTPMFDPSVEPLDQYVTTPGNWK